MVAEKLNSRGSRERKKWRMDNSGLGLRGEADQGIKGSLNRVYEKEM